MYIKEGEGEVGREGRQKNRNGHGPPTSNALRIKQERFETTGRIPEIRNEMFKNEYNLGKYFFFGEIRVCTRGINAIYET